MSEFKGAHVGLVSKAIIIFVVASIIGVLVPTYFPNIQVLWFVIFGPLVSFVLIIPLVLHQIAKNRREAEEAAREERASRARS